MSGRLLSWPQGLQVTNMEFLSGPRSVGAGATQSVGNFLQTFSSPFGLLRIRMEFGPMEGMAARRYRGWTTALHAGANATRVPWLDADNLSPAEAGVVGNLSPQTWSNGQPWSNGRMWKATLPNVAVAAASAKSDVFVSLANSFWGHALGIGDELGFFPFHFGVYEVTEVVEPGHYRVWPPLRKAIATSDFATLHPTLAMRLESEDAATRNRAADFIRDASVTLVEVEDDILRDYFAD